MHSPCMVYLKRLKLSSGIASPGPARASHSFICCIAKLLLLTCGQLSHQLTHCSDINDEYSANEPLPFIAVFGTSVLCV